jgi:hypothetical protein
VISLHFAAADFGGGGRMPSSVRADAAPGRRTGMKTSLELIVANKFRLTATLLAITVVAVGGATYGSWAVGSAAGDAYAKAVSAQDLTLSDGSATVADLYPGGTGAVKITVTNPNGFAVTVTAVSGAGTITSDKGASCNSSTGVTFTDTTGLSQVVGAGATATFSLAGKAALSNGSANACQGAIFTIPVTLSATS